MIIISKILPDRKKTNTAYAAWISILIALIVSSNLIFGANQLSNGPLQDKIRVGVLNTPPFSYYLKGKPTGLAYDIWELVASNNLIQSEYIDVGGNVDAAVSKVNSGEIDVVIGKIGLLSSRERVGHFSLPFFHGNFVLVAKQIPMNIVQRFIDTIKVIPTYLFLMVGIIYLSYILLFHIFEHAKQPELLNLSRYSAFELIFWRSLVNGIRSPPFFPETRVMRALSVCWTLFFTGLLFSMIAGMTSILVSSWVASGEKLISLSDLDNKFVDVQGGNMSADIAGRIGLNIAQLDQSVDDAIKRLNNHSVDAIFMSRSVAVNYFKTHPKGDLYLSKIDLPGFYLGYFFNSKFRGLLTGINYSILKITESGEQQLLCKKYLGAQLSDLLCL